MVHRARRRLGAVQQIREGEDRVAGDDLLDFAPAEAHLPARLAAQHAGIRHAARQHLREEVGHHRLHRPSLLLVGQEGRLAAAHRHPGSRDGADEVGSLRLGPLQLGEERARLGEGGVVRGGGVAIDRPHAQRPRLALAGDLLRGLRRLEGERRDHGLPGRLADDGEVGDDTGGRRKEDVPHQGRTDEGQPAEYVVSNRVAQTPGELGPGRQRPFARRHQPLWSSAYALMISRTRRWRTTSVSFR